MTTVNITRSIDARGMPCPGPLMSLIGAIREGQVGDVIEVLSSRRGLEDRYPGVAREGRPRARGGRRGGRLRPLRDPQGAVTRCRPGSSSSGGGVGGTLVANLLDKELGRDGEGHRRRPDRDAPLPARATCTSRSARRTGGGWSVTSARCCADDVDLVVDEAIRIHPDAGTVQLERGGSARVGLPRDRDRRRLVHDQVPGLVEGSHGFYSLEDAQRLREELRRFRGGRVLVGIAGIPYKCPPAPVEFVFMLEEYLRKRGIRERSEVTLLSPLNRALHDRVGEQGHPADPGGARHRADDVLQRRGRSTRARTTVTSLEGEKAEYDLLVLVPPHRGQSVDRATRTSAIRRGWLPTDRYTLQVEGQERIFAMGDATNLPISKSGSTAHFEAPVVASRIASLVRGTRPEDQLRRPRHVLPGDGQPQGDGAAVRLRAPAGAAAAEPVWHSAKWMFNRMYWETVPQGRIPESTAAIRREGGDDDEHADHARRST